MTTNKNTLGLSAPGVWAVFHLRAHDEGEVPSSGRRFEDATARRHCDSRNMFLLMIVYLFQMADSRDTASCAVCRSPALLPALRCKEYVDTSAFLH